MEVVSWQRYERDVDWFVHRNSPKRRFAFRFLNVRLRGEAENLMQNVPHSVRRLPFQERDHIVSPLCHASDRAVRGIVPFKPFFIASENDRVER